VRSQSDNWSNLFVTDGTEAVPGIHALVRVPLPAGTARSNGPPRPQFTNADLEYARKVLEVMEEHEMPESAVNTMIRCHECDLDFLCPNAELAAKSLAGTVHTPPRRGLLAGLVGRVKGMFGRKSR
jgi:hypothetical protein